MILCIFRKLVFEYFWGLKWTINIFTIKNELFYCFQEIEKIICKVLKFWYMLDRIKTFKLFN